jgi:hypothetical protein
MVVCGFQFPVPSSQFQQGLNIDLGNTAMAHEVESGAFQRAGLVALGGRMGTGGSLWLAFACLGLFWACHGQPASRYFNRGRRVCRDRGGAARYLKPCPDLGQRKVPFSHAEVSLDRAPELILFWSRRLSPPSLSGFGLFSLRDTLLSSPTETPQEPESAIQNQSLHQAPASARASRAFLISRPPLPRRRRETPEPKPSPLLHGHICSLAPPHLFIQSPRPIPSTLFRLTSPST